MLIKITLEDKRIKFSPESEKITSKKANESKGNIDEKDILERCVAGLKASSLQIELDYCLATNFSYLPVKIKEAAKDLRKKLLKINNFQLESIKLEVSTNKLLLTYSTENSSTEVKLFAPANHLVTEFDDENDDENEAKKAPLCPQKGISFAESLTPWFLQKKLYIHSEKQPLVPKPLKSSATKNKEKKAGRPKRIRSFTPYLSDYIVFDYQIESYEFIKEYFGEKYAKTKEITITVAELKELAEQAKKPVPILERRLFLDYYNDFIERIEICHGLDISKYKDWASLKRSIRGNYLYTILMAKSQNEAFLTSEVGAVWKKNIFRLIPSLENKLTALKDFLRNDIGKFKIAQPVTSLKNFPYYKDGYDLSVKERDCFFCKFPYSLDSSSLKEEFDEYRKKYPFEKETLIGNYITPGNSLVLQEDFTRAICSFSVSNETNCITSNFIPPNESVKLSVSRPNQILTPANSASFESFAIVTNEDAALGIDKSLDVIGEIKENIPPYALWALLRQPEIKEQINKYHDPYIDNICFKSIFDKIELLDIDIEDMKSPLAEVCYEIACMISRTKYPHHMIHYKFTEKVKNLILSTSWKRYALLHKMNVIAREGRGGRKRCMILCRDDKSYGTKIRVVLKKDIFYISSVKKKEDIYRLYKALMECNICLIAFEGKENRRELEIIRNVINIVKSNHLLVTHGETSPIGPAPLEIQVLFSNFPVGALNYCQYGTSNRNMFGNIRALTERNDYIWSVYRDFFLILANCTCEDFKRIPSGNDSQTNTRRAYKHRELELFNNLKPLMVKKALLLGREESEISLAPESINIDLLKHLEELINPYDILYDLENIWASFKDYYKNDLPLGPFHLFINKNLDYIKAMEDFFPKLIALNKLKEDACKRWDKGKLNENEPIAKLFKLIKKKKKKSNRARSVVKKKS